MKKILIAINGFNISEGISNQVTRLTDELTKRGFCVETKKNTEIMAYIENGEIKSKIFGYEFCLYLDKDKYIAQMLEKTGLKLFNSSTSIELCDDKMLTHIALSNHQIKMPTTISSMLCYNDNGNREYLNKIEEKLGFPMIVKHNFGSLGKQVFLVKNPAELKDIEEKLIKIPHIFQEFISSSCGKDYRVIVIGGKAVAWMKRENKNSYLSNLAQGGTSSVCDLPKSYIEMAQNAAKILKLDYCGVDLLSGPNNEPILSEVNSNAFFEGIEKTTGINVVSQYIDYLIK